MKNCVILAGGKSSRMGRDKTLLPYGGFATLTHFQAHKFARIFERVFVSSKFEKFDPPLPLIKDASAEEILRLNLARTQRKNVNLRDFNADIFLERESNLADKKAGNKFKNEGSLFALSPSINHAPQNDEVFQPQTLTQTFDLKTQILASEKGGATALKLSSDFSSETSSQYATLNSKKDGSSGSNLEQNEQKNQISCGQNSASPQTTSAQANLSADAFSPMLALYSILRNFKNESVFIIPADMPFVSESCVRELHKFAAEYDMVIAADEEHTHSLCGFFSANLADAAGELFAAGEHKIGLLRGRCRCKIVKFAAADEFFNINYPADYERALKEGKV